MDVIWVILIIAGLLTFLTRLSFIVLLGKWTPPIWVGRALRFVPPAVLTAILVPELLMRNNHFVPANPRLLAGALAGALAAGVAWRTKSVILTIIIGMTALILIQSLFS